MNPLVLIIEDDIDIREGLVEFLAEEENFRVIAAANGKEALHLLNSGPRPDVVLLDLMMPVMDGVEFREHQLRDPELAKLPVVVLSADGRMAQISREIGVSASIRKPFDPFELAKLLRKAIQEPRTTTEHQPWAKRLA